jgi:hypothetical protein
VRQFDSTNNLQDSLIRGAVEYDFTRIGDSNIFVSLVPVQSCMVPVTLGGLTGYADLRQFPPVNFYTNADPIILHGIDFSQTVKIALTTRWAAKPGANERVSVITTAAQYLNN